MKKSILVLSVGFATVSSAQMTMNANWAIYNDCDCYTLTNGTTNKKGAIWSVAPIDLTQSFDMTFQVMAGFADGEADGMAFVLQQNATGIGDNGNSLGYRDISTPSVPPISLKSLAIELDTWDSSPTVATDIASDHIGIEFNNSNEHNLGGPYAVPNVEDGGYHAFRVMWDPTLQIMSVLLDGSPVFAYNGDIITNIFTGNPSVYFGWTAATGGSPGTHRVCMYRDADFAPDVTEICPHLPIYFTDNSTSDLNNYLYYSWDFGDGSPLDASQNPMHVYNSPGTYDVSLYFTDYSGCEDTATVTITVLPDLIIDVVGTDPLCFGDVDGQATATSQNGTGPYSYTWDDALTQTTQTATNLPPNATYIVNVVDDLGCVGTGTVTINEPLEMLVDIVGTDVSCFGSADGVATSSVTNGTSPFDYLWSDPLAQTAFEATGLAPGTYFVDVIDDNGCEGSDTIVIGEPTEIFITGVVTYDNGTTNGTIDATITGGTTPYASTIWSNSATTEDINGLAAGDYTITVTDANGCTKDTTFSIKSSVGLAETHINGFEIYPNPTNGSFQIKGEGGYLVTITDASGKLILKNAATNSYWVDLGEVAGGVYFVAIEQDDRTYNIKLVIE